MAVTHICFIGASTTEGLGDEARLGWPGRLIGLAPAAERLHAAYNLGVQGQTVTQIGRRWQAECETRLPENVAGAVIFFFGLNDIAQVDGGPLRSPMRRILGQVTDIITSAKVRWPVLWVGAAPVAEDCMPFRSETGHSFDYRNERIAGLNQAYANIAAAADIPYLDLFDDLLRDPVWFDALRLGDGLHPTGAGYQRFAEKVAAWPAWQGLF